MFYFIQAWLRISINWYGATCHYIHFHAIALHFYIYIHFVFNIYITIYLIPVALGFHGFVNNRMHVGDILCTTMYIHAIYKILFRIDLLIFVLLNGDKRATQQTRYCHILNARLQSTPTPDSGVTKATFDGDATALAAAAFGPNQFCQSCGSVLLAGGKECLAPECAVRPPVYAPTAPRRLGPPRRLFCGHPCVPAPYT